MEMRATADITTGQDLTPPLRPLAAVLRDSAVTSHCSACFSPLPFPQNTQNTPPFPHNPHHVPTPLYCSPTCSSSDSPLSSGGSHLLLQSTPSTWTDSSDLRLSLRLITIFQKITQDRTFFQKLSTCSHQKVLIEANKDNPFRKNENHEGPCDYLDKIKMCCQNDVVLERVVGLMTNREKLVFGQNRNDVVLERIREGAKLIGEARRMCLDDHDDVNVGKNYDFVLEEMVLCLVLTNAVEVQDKSGCAIGVAVYGTAFSWINHSCSPNACYRFLLGQESRYDNDLLSKGDDDLCTGDVENYGYGPRVVVRSIRAVSKGEEVTIAYTDLLQPKEMRQSELWSKYRFICSCKRCSSVPATYVDNALQALSPDTTPEFSDDELEKLMQSFDDAINDYLSSDDPISCCEKLENLLTHGHLIESNEAKSPQKLKLHPFHYISLNAYTTLASAYKVRANDLSALYNDVERQNLEAFSMSKTSSGYSLLLAGVSNHLFVSESAFITTVKNFWINAGESMLNLARSSLWGSFRSDFSSILTRKCDNCCLEETFEPKSISPDRNMEFEDKKSRLSKCIADITPKVWSILACGSSFLRVIRNPIEFSWLAFPETSVVLETSQLEDEECSEQVRVDLVVLSIHCLRYGALLSTICYGLSAEMNCYRTLDFLKEFD